MNPKLYELGKSNPHGNNRNSRYGNRGGGGGGGAGNTGGNAFRTNRPFGNNSLNGNRPNAFSNGTENAFRRDRQENVGGVGGVGGGGSRFSDAPSRYPSNSLNGSGGTSRFSSGLNPSAPAASSNSSNGSSSRYGNSSDVRYGSSNGTSAGGVRESGGSRFSAPNPSSATSRFSSSDAYNGKSATASSGNDFYQNSSAKFKPYPDTKSAYGDSKAKPPITGSSASGPPSYPPPYSAYGSESHTSMFSYPPPPIH